MGSGQLVTVFGAYGHTGRFVVAELAARGFVPVLSGRNVRTLEEMAREHGQEARAASVEDPASLDRPWRARRRSSTAPPFASTTGPVVEAALRARIPYLDVAAELEANLDTFARYRERARDAKAVIVPAMAFFEVSATC